MITLIGLGPGDPDLLTRGAERALYEASRATQEGTGTLLLRTARHPVVEALRDWGLKFATFDALYDSAPDFDTVYTEIALRVIEAHQHSGAAAGHVWYAVPGHPLIGEESTGRIRAAAQPLGIPVRVVASGSFVEATLAAAGAQLADGFDVRDALTLAEADAIDRNGDPTTPRVDVTRGLLLFQVYDAASASHTKLALMRDYPDDWPVQLIRSAGIPGQEAVKSLPLYRLDHEPVDHLTSVYVPPLPPHLRTKTFPALVGIMARLRAPDGCPWDREQTHATLKRYFIEETYEVIEAIDAEDPDLLCEELGDALLQVVFHAQLASEEGLFNIDDVTAHIVTKLVRRHPHVFGTVAVEDSAEVLRNWEQIKKTEKTGEKARKSILDGIPQGLPALMQAQELSKRVVKVGFEWERFADVLGKLDEELGELRAELSAPTPNRDRIASELGDLLFTIVQVARWQKLDAEDALRGMLARFSRRFRYIERCASEQGRALTDMPLAEMDALWNEAKTDQGI
jgi:tetrapyrrole methylase family protein/MazG family protein